MNKLMILIIVFFSLNIYGQNQNLIPNGGFDSIKTCPSAGSNITDILPQWFTANKYGTPDVYNRCADFTSAGVPTHWGNRRQESKSGDGYAGIAIYSELESNGREYIEVRLLEQLVKNTNYFVRYYVSPSSYFFKWQGAFSATDAKVCMR